MNNTSIVKPTNSQWTNEQWQAITEHGQDILVAAAAGSGKTAVLVERIIKKMTDAEHPVNVDQLLIVTFTNAAAAEMRSRISQAIDEALLKDPSSLFLRRQQALLGKASIMTCHAFCMSVIKKYYYMLDLDPNFRLLDQTEAALIKDDILNDLFEDYYANGQDNGFFDLVDRYSGDRNDAYIQDLILKLYDFSRSHPWPNAWLNEMAASYHVQAGTQIDSFSFTSDLINIVKHKLIGMMRRLDRAGEIIQSPGGPSPYGEAIQVDRVMIDQLMAHTHESWGDIYQAFQSVSFTKLKSCRDKTIDDDLKDQVKTIREQVKKELTTLKNEWFSRSPESFLNDLKEMAPSVDLLVKLIQDFDERYQSVKREQGVADFSDLEHHCLQILRSTESKPGKEIPSVVAEQYRSLFNEVLVDEYQDTNLVQETIVKLVSGGTSEEGNLFMVGDVKQSVYRFRLAEPGLFIEKYKQFSDQKDNHNGLKIDLSRNFRSRQNILTSTNFIFRQIMNEEVGDIDYDDAAELKFGAKDYPEGDEPTELILIDREHGEEELEDGDQINEISATELEGYQIAKRIKQMVDQGYPIYDRKKKTSRPIQYRDVVILMRSTHKSAPLMLDILKEAGIPAYAELSTGYFDATEILVMLSVLQIIDNPYQDIPLVSVLRSPIIGLNGDELTTLRLYEKDNLQFYEVVKRYAEEENTELAQKMRTFLYQLESWRSMSKAHAVSELIWQIYRDTGYYDFVAGLVGGTERQANLRALYDRARQYEKTSFRGLFRFLKFIERMRDRGDDLGAAKALSEQEDVVRIMTIHKSKGLEFPVVFVAGLTKRFNMQDLNQRALLHKQLGFGTRYIDPVKRISFPTLPFIAIKQKLAEETLAEEMRILYVALTRAKEKLILVSALKDVEKTISSWKEALFEKEWILPTHMRNKAKTYLDWIGPAIMRHQDASVFHDIAGEDVLKTTISLDSSTWDIQIVLASTMDTHPIQAIDQVRLNKVRQGESVSVSNEWKQAVEERLNWVYPYQHSEKAMAKQTVTEIKAQQTYFSEGAADHLLDPSDKGISVDRPRFMQQGKLSATEKGTALHVMMQHVDLTGDLTPEAIKLQGVRLVEKEILTIEQEESLDYQAIAKFFTSPIGLKMLHAQEVVRECAFSYILDAKEVYPGWNDDCEEGVIVQGVVDCIIIDDDGMTLLDYKTDKITSRYQAETEAKAELIKRYNLQLNLYKKAIEKIWKRKVHRMGLYAFDGGYFVEIEEGEKP
ncbi:helicase-exonuclease AddAB subunit AddA [Terrilactibacillus laevilacticus]|uniref:helicase-exonuclease AddAB subunit AddA n=1 Tax=Terrilactibacillus laevilacticus TaxID=1380157 RepID=UPI00114705DD|nr:helicase-exonuclease AddAB subunit AddA [Terrilactibacillus laevilacticus]